MLNQNIYNIYYVYENIYINEYISYVFKYILYRIAIGRYIATLRKKFKL